MALSRKLKIWIIVLSIPIGLIVAGIFVAKLYFTSERLKELVIPPLREATHREVAIADITLSFFPSFGLSIDGLTISTAAGADYDRLDLLAIDHVTVNVKLLGLLSDKLEITHVAVDRPRVYLEVNKDGRKNYSSAAVQQAASHTGSGTTNTGALLLANLEITGGEIEYINKKFDSRMKVAGLRQTARAELRSGENVVLVEGSSSIESFSYGSLGAWYLSGQPIQADEQLSYRIADDVLVFDDVKVHVREMPLRITGKISQLQQTTLMMDIDVSSPGVKMDQLLSLIPPELLQSAKGLASSGDVAFRTSIKGPSSETMNPAVIGSFSVANGTVRYSGFPQSITNINVEGSFEQPSAPIMKKDIGTFNIEKLTASPGNDRISGALSVTNFENPHLTASFNGLMNLNNVHTYYPLEKGTELNGIMKASNIALDGKVNSPQTMKAGGAIEFQNVAIQSAGSKQPIRNLNGTITFNNQKIESKQLALTIGESDLNLAFSLKDYLAMIAKDSSNKSVKPSATVTLRSRQLRTADLMGDENTTSSKTSGAAKASPAGGGMLPGFDIDADVAIDKLVTEKFTFTNARGAAAIAGGIINLKNFAVNAFNGEIVTRGTLDVRDQAKRPFNLDLDIKGVESNAFLSNFTSFGQYLFGKFSTTTKLQGDLNDTLGLNPKTLLGDGTVQIAEGKLLGFPLTQKLASFTGLDDLKAVNFKEWTNAFSVSNGRFNVKNLNVNTGTTSLLLGGSQGLDGSLDYLLTLKLPESVSERMKIQGVGSELLQFLKDKEGRINLGFQVTGTASEPVLRFDTEAPKEMARKALEQKGNEAKQKLENELRKKAVEGLKNLLKRP